MSWLGQTNLLTQTDQQNKTLIVNPSFLLVSNLLSVLLAFHSRYE